MSTVKSTSKMPVLTFRLPLQCSVFIKQGDWADIQQSSRGGGGWRTEADEQTNRRLHTDCTGGIVERRCQVRTHAMRFRIEKQYDGSRG